MKRFLHIDLARRDWTSTDLHGEDMVRAGRHLIARMLLERGVATVDALSPENPLIFSAGPLAGTAFSNANRISVGCKSPLTGGIKEANSGGMFAVAQGTARLREHFGIGRVPVIKRQAISAYDPRVVEVTGISMMTTARGADHTAGAIAAMDCGGKTTRELVAASLDAQFKFAVSDRMGLCIFGRSVTDANYEMMAEAVNGCLGIAIEPSLLREIGRETVWMELEFNRRAGFTPDDDRLPAFFYDEALPPSDKAARPFNDVRQCMDALMAAEMDERHFST